MERPPKAPSINGKSPRKRLSSEERRAALLRAAVELFSKRGFAGTTTKQIADAAGVSEALLFQHYATKHDLYTAIIDHRVGDEEMEAWFSEIRRYAEERNDEALFVALATGIAESYRLDPQFQRVMLFSSLEEHALAKLFHEKRGKPVFCFLCDYIETRQREGAFREGDPGTIVMAFTGMPSHYATVRWLYRINVVERPDLDVVSDFARMLLAGLKAEAPRRGRKKNS